MRTENGGSRERGYRGKVLSKQSWTGESSLLCSRGGQPCEPAHVVQRLYLMGI